MLLGLLGGLRHSNFLKDKAWLLKKSVSQKNTL